MGGGGSKSQSTTLVENNIVNRNTFEALNEVVNSQGNEMVSNQSAEISNVLMIGCEGEIGQRYEGKMTIINELSAEQTTEMLDKIIDNLENELATSAGSESGFADFMNGESTSDTYQDIKNNITTEIKNTVTNRTVNETVSKMYVNQELVVKDIVFDPLGLEGWSATHMETLSNLPTNFPPDAYVTLVNNYYTALATLTDNNKRTCSITQDAIVEFTSQQIGNVIANTINRNETVRELVTQAQGDASAKTEGAGEAVGDAAEGIGTGIATGAEGIGTGVATGAEGIGTGVATGAEGIGDGVASGAQGIGAGAAMAMSGPFIPFAIASSASMAMMMMMMMMSKKGGMDPAMMAILARK